MLEGDKQVLHNKLQLKPFSKQVYIFYLINRCVMQKKAMLLIFGALLVASTAFGQSVAVEESWNGIDKHELALRLSQDDAFREYIFGNKAYLKVVDDWIESLSPAQRKAWKEGDLLMPEFYTEEDKKQHYQRIGERLQQVMDRFPELRQLSKQQSSWVRGRASDLVLNEAEE